MGADRDGERRHPELGLVDAARVPALADRGELLAEHVGHHDGVAGTRWETGAQPGFEHFGDVGGEHLAGARTVYRRPPRVAVDVPQGVHTFDALDVHDVAAVGYADLNRLAERVAQLDEHRQGAVTHRGTDRCELAVLDEAQSELVRAGRCAPQQAPPHQHRTRAVGGALGDADAARQFAQPELAVVGQGVDDVERDGHRLQRRPFAVRECRTRHRAQPTSMLSGSTLTGLS